MAMMTPALEDSVASKGSDPEANAAAAITDLQMSGDAGGSTGGGGGSTFSDVRGDVRKNFDIDLSVQEEKREEATGQDDGLGYPDTTSSGTVSTTSNDSSDSNDSNDSNDSGDSNDLEGTTTSGSGLPFGLSQTQALAGAAVLVVGAGVVTAGGS